MTDIKSWRVIIPLFFCVFFSMESNVMPGKIDVKDEVIRIFIREKIAAYSLSLKGAGYRPGGEDREYGFDCSGFTQHVYSAFGIKLPRTVYAQYNSAIRYGINKIKKGDIVFFNTKGYGPSHTGIYLGNGKFIHAPGIGKKVSIGSLSDKYWARVFMCGGNFLR